MKRTSIRRTLGLVASVLALTAATLVVGSSPASAALSNSKLPTISGKVQVGQTIKASRGVWKGAYEPPVSTQYTYQWYANNVAIPNAKATSLKLTPTEVNKVITVRVTAKKAPQPPITVSSLPTDPVAPGVIKADTLHIEGINKVGHTQAVTPGHWKPNDVTFTIIWLADGNPTAFGYHYTPGPAQAGTKTAVTVLGTKAGYTPLLKVLTRYGTVRP